jgi:hypothetical protein
VGAVVTGATLVVADGFDLHVYRHGLKLLRDDGTTTWLVNRRDLRCPACECRFERLVVTETGALSFDDGPGGPFCLVRTPGQLLLLTH